jgi:hypothetical protein
MRSERTQTLTPLPPGAELLQAGGKLASGNILLLFREPEPACVLKLYRFRRSRFRERCKDFAQRVLEGKRGATAKARHDTEAAGVRCWMREGFDVVRPVDRPRPDGIKPPAAWFEYCDAPRLDEVLCDDAVDQGRKAVLARELAAVCAGRHRRAVELREPLLVHEHGNVNHVFVDGDRLVFFDLENGFRPGFPIVEALAQEVAGFLRSIVKFGGASSDELLKEFVAGYTDQDLLRRVLEHAVESRSLVRRLKRWHDRRKRGDMSKTRIMERALMSLHSVPRKNAK